MDRTASGCQPDQQGSPQVPAAELDQTLMLEFDSVLDEAGLASPNSAAADSADRSADQDPSSDEYSELIEDSSPQPRDPGTSPGAGAEAAAGDVQQPEQSSQLDLLGHSTDVAPPRRRASPKYPLEPAQTAFSEQRPAVPEPVNPAQQQQQQPPVSTQSQTVQQLEAVTASLQSMMTVMAQMPQQMAAIAKDVVDTALKQTATTDRRCSAFMPAQQRGGGMQQLSKDQDYDGKRGGMPDQLPGTVLSPQSVPTKPICVES